MSTVVDGFRLDGKTVLLTGATAGIGRRFAEVLVDAGARVALVARRQDVLDELTEALPRTVALSADLSDPLAGRNVAAWALDQLGPIDVIVNNAGGLAKGVKAEDESLEAITETINLNLVAPIRIVQALFPTMRAQGSGSIINITSMVASIGIGRFPQAAYSASKGGLQAITREWAAQWSRYGIRVNAIAPGMIETEIVKNVINIPKINEWILRNTLLPRHGQPDDFDGAILYLASDMSRYVTGQTLTVDGGWTAH